MGYGKKIAFTGAGIVAAIFFVAWLANRTDVLNKFVKGATSIGSAIGQGVGGGIGAVPIGFGQGISGFKSYEDWWSQFWKNPFGLGPLLPPTNEQVPPPPPPLLLPPAAGDTGPQAPRFPTPVADRGKFFFTAARNVTGTGFVFGTNILASPLARTGTDRAARFAQTAEGAARISKQMMEARARVAKSRAQQAIR